MCTHEARVSCCIIGTRTRNLADDTLPPKNPHSLSLGPCCNSCAGQSRHQLPLQNNYHLSIQGVLATVLLLAVTISKLLCFDLIGLFHLYVLSAGKLQSMASSSSAAVPGFHSVTPDCKISSSILLLSCLVPIPLSVSLLLHLCPSFGSLFVLH